MVSLFDVEEQYQQDMAKQKRLMRLAAEQIYEK